MNDDPAVQSCDNTAAHGMHIFKMFYLCPGVVDPPSFDDWLDIGIAKGWVGAPVCGTHDGTPTSAQEDAEFEESDPCIHILRLYYDAEHKAAVEDNHSPSVWRRTNRGSSPAPTQGAPE